MEIYSYFQVLCTIHTLQLSVNDTLKSVKAFGAEMETVLKKSKTLANYVRKSGPATQELKAACEELKITYTTLKNPQETRWNSQNTNLASLIKVKSALVKLANDDTSGDWATRGLTAAEWKLAEGAVKVLDLPLYVTKAWEAETTPTMNLVISELYSMKIKLESYVGDISKCK